MIVSKLERQDAVWGKIAGNWATLLLPINQDDSIDLARLAEEIDTLVAAKVDGIYSNGTAGEFHNQTEVEFDAIQALLAERCRAANMPFVIGACQPDPRLSLERLKRAASLKPDGIQVILPDWWPVTDPEAVDFLQMMVEAASGVPLILYNPPHAKRVLKPQELANILKEVPEIVGVKLADGNEEWYDQAATYLDAVALYVPGHHLATGVRHKVAAGAFSNVACLSPLGAQRWTRQMTVDLEGALDIERRLCAFMDRHIAPFREKHGYSNAALDKLLAAIGDWAPVGTRLRRPYRWIEPGEAVRLAPVARAEIPEIFAN